MLTRPLLFMAVLCATSTEARGEHVARVDVRGNRKVETDALRALLLTRAGDALDRELVRADLRALWRTGLFEDVRVEATPGPGRGAPVAVAFVVAERPLVRKLVVDGNEAVSLARIDEVLRLRRDAILSPAVVEADRARIAALYADEGYALAEVRAAVRPVDDGAVDVWFTVVERARAQVRRVELLGNAAIADDELRAVIATRPGSSLPLFGADGVYREQALARDLTRIAAYYQDRGYAQVRVGAPRVELSRDKRSIYVTIPIDEGPVYTLASVAVTGDAVDVGPSSSRAGEVARLGAVAGDVERLRRRLRDRGYAYATVVPRQRVDPEAHTLALTFEVERGVPVYVERISIRGAAKTRDKVIRRELTIAEGELFSQSAVDESRRRVAALGYFGRVGVSTRRGSAADLIELDVEVSERRADTVQLGFGFSTADHVLGQAQLSLRNLAGRGQSFELSALISGARQLYNLRFHEPHVADTEWSAAVDLFRTRRVLGAHGVDRASTGGALSWGRALGPHTHAALRYEYEDVDVTGPGGVANLYRGGVSSSVRLSLQRDTRDDRLLPTDGTLLAAFVEVADRFTGSQNTFVRFGGNARYYRRLWGPLVLKLNADVGVVTSRDPLGVPLTERYLLGGIHDVRGFAPSSLGPQLDVLDGEQLRRVAIGGNLKAVANAELEFPLARALGLTGVVFFDAGNAYNLERRYCDGAGGDRPVKSDPCFGFPDALLGGLRRSVGVGVRWLSPIGPLRFEWGIPLDRQPGEGWIDFQFAIGGSF